MDKKSWKFLSVFLFVLLLILLVALQVQANLSSSNFILDEETIVADFSISEQSNVLKSKASQGSGGATVPIMSAEISDSVVEYRDTRPSRLQFDFKGKPYAIQLWRIKEGHAEFVVLALDSDNLENVMAHATRESFALEAGEEKDIDIDGDGIYDLSIELSKTDSPFSVDGTRIREGIRTADFSIKRISSR